MHEASIALELAQSASKIARENGATKITKIGIRIGRLSSIIPESLLFAFPQSASGTLAEGAELQIESVEIIAKCLDCGAVQIDLQFGLVCPFCGKPTPTILQGEELEIESIELL